jgi:hypothetical protein
VKTLESLPAARLIVRALTATVALAALKCPPALAEDAAATAAAPTLAQILAASGISATGYLAVSDYHSSGLGTFHQFDDHHVATQLDQGALTIAYKPKDGFGTLVDVLAGEDARIVQVAEDGHDNELDVLQAYVQYAAGPVTVVGGKYLTLAGAEVIDPTGDTNFSRSLLFYSEPMTHTGVRATWAATPTITLTGGVNNGWNVVSDSCGGKTAEVGVTVTPGKQLSLSAQAYFGKAPSPYGMDRSLVDLVGTYNITAALSIVLSYDRGWQSQPDSGDMGWNGLAAYLNYAISAQWRLSARGEYFDDAGGFVTGARQKLAEGTLTLGYAPTSHFELRLEGRHDRSNHPTFSAATSGPQPTPFEDAQTEFAVQGLFKF